MRLGSSLVAIGMLAGATAASASQALGHTQAARPPEKIYAVTCGYCHGTNVGPIILGRHLPPASILFMTRNGRNAMPAFRPTEISNAELEKLAAWISASAANPKEQGK